MTLLPNTPPAQAESGRIKGVVYYDDGTGNRGVAGVEVFLGIQSDPFVARYTCTDAYGAFIFSDVPLDTDLIAAVGIEVEFAQRCANPLALSPDGTGRRRRPLLIESWDNHDGVLVHDQFRVTAHAPQADMKFTLLAWPTGGDGALNSAIILGIQQFQRGQIDRAIRTFELFKSLVNQYRGRGRLDAATANALNLYADTLINLFNSRR
jgi:hypothetical protein